jgi:segregation and condensation protein B
MNSKFALLEASLFAAGIEGLTVFDLKKVYTELNAEEIRDIIEEYEGKLNLDQNSGLNVILMGGKYKLMTKPEFYDDLAKLVEIKQVKPLRQSIMETLSIIAYNQPCTRKKIDEIRGTNNV